ncbi:MAG: hypothetical protein WA634_16735 [Silvibacterium sp.]
MNVYARTIEEFFVARKSILILMALFAVCAIPICCGIAARSLFAQTDSASVSVLSGVANTVRIDVPGQSAFLHFAGEAGQLASVQVSESSFSGGCNSLVMVVVGPNGSNLTSHGVCGQDQFILGPIDLPVSGIYSVKIGPTKRITGDAQITLFLFSDVTASISSGIAHIVSIDNPGQRALLKFAGEAGELATVDLDSSSFLGECCSALVGILDSSGTRLPVSNTCGQGACTLASVVLPTSGTYTLVINPINGSVGSTVVFLSLAAKKGPGTQPPGYSHAVTPNVLCRTTGPCSSNNQRWISRACPVKQTRFVDWNSVLTAACNLGDPGQVLGQLAGLALHP